MHGSTALRKILHIDEKVVVTVPLVYGNEYYLACGFGDKKVEFDVKEVPFVRPEYTYGIYSLSELEGTDLFPVMKFKVSDGIFPSTNLTFLLVYIYRLTIASNRIWSNSQSKSAYWQNIRTWNQEKGNVLSNAMPIC